ncbi:hypothetical protein [Moraxella cuniculi]|nr:hypothetical protein [Moraxella cuniculi]
MLILSKNAGKSANELARMLSLQAYDRFHNRFIDECTADIASGQSGDF